MFSDSTFRRLRGSHAADADPGDVHLVAGGNLTRTAQHVARDDQEGGGRAGHGGRLLDELAAIQGLGHDGVSWWFR